MTDSYPTSIEEWRRDYERKLVAPASWLTIVGLVWLQEGLNTFGANPGNAIVLSAASMPPFAGSFVRQADKIMLQVNSGIDTFIGGHIATSEPIPINERGSSEPITIDRFTLFVIRRGQQYGVRIYDPESPARQSFSGVQWFPIDIQYRVEAAFSPADSIHGMAVTNILGMVEESSCPGYVTFTLGGQDYHLYPVAPSAEHEFFFMFRDATNGKSTYPAGRYLYTAPPRNGLIMLDFNKCYSPPCAFTDYATCTLPPPQNHLPIPILAGAKYDYS